MSRPLDRPGVLCLGLGFTTTCLADLFPSSYRFAFLTRDPGQATQRGRRIVNPEAGPETAPAFIVDSVPALQPEARNLPYHAVVRAILDRSPETPYLHLSSTSVYPGADRPFQTPRPPRLDEEALAIPDTERGARRLRLEQEVLNRYPQARILRCGGIYGPGRSLAERFRDGDFTRASVGNRWVSRIHVHDLARLMVAAATAPDAPRIVNAVDERPASNREVFGFLEDLLSITVPGDWRTESAVGRAIGSGFRAALLPDGLRFPSYREGFRNCLG